MFRVLAFLFLVFGFAYLLIETGDFPSDIAPETQYMLSTSGILIAIAAIPLAFYIFSYLKVLIAISVTKTPSKTTFKNLNF